MIGFWKLYLDSKNFIRIIRNFISKKMNIYFLKIFWNIQKKSEN